MKIFAIILAIFTLNACSSMKKKEAPIKPKVNTEIYRAVCFDPEDTKYVDFDNVEMIKFDNSGFLTKVKGEEIVFPPYCMFEQKYKLKASTKIDKSRKFQVKCDFDPFYYKSFVGTDYYLYKTYGEESLNIKLVNSETRQILLLSMEFCSVSVQNDDEVHQ